MSKRRPWVVRKYGTYVPSYPEFQFDPENWYKKPMTTLIKPHIRLHCNVNQFGVTSWWAVVRLPIHDNPHVEVVRWKSPTYNHDTDILLGRVKGFMRKGQ